MSCGLPISDAVEAQQALNDAIDEPMIKLVGNVILSAFALVAILVGLCISAKGVIKDTLSFRC